MDRTKLFFAIHPLPGKVRCKYQLEAVYYNTPTQRSVILIYLAWICRVAYKLPEYTQKYRRKFLYVIQIAFPERNFQYRFRNLQRNNGNIFMYFWSLVVILFEMNNRVCSIFCLILDFWVSFEFNNNWWMFLCTYVYVILERKIKLNLNFINFLQYYSNNFVKQYFFLIIQQLMNLSWHFTCKYHVYLVLNY